MLENNTPEAEVILDFILSRIRKRLGCLILFTGNPGSSKSYSGIRLLELWYKKYFNLPFPSDNICASLEPAILKIKDFKTIGEGIIIEELSVLASVRDSLTRQNKIWNSFLDTCRIKQAVIIGNIPHRSFVDKHVVMLTNLWIDMLGINFTKQIAVGKPLILQTSPHSSKVYKHRLVDKKGDAVDLIFFKKPSPELNSAYDNMKKKNVEQLYFEIAQRMKLERIRQLREIGHRELTKRQEEVYKLGLQGYSNEQIANRLGVQTPVIITTFTRIREKLRDNKLLYLENQEKNSQN